MTRMTESISSKAQKIHGWKNGQSDDIKEQIFRTNIRKSQIFYKTFVAGPTGQLNCLLDTHQKCANHLK